MTMKRAFTLLALLALGAMATEAAYAKRGSKRNSRVKMRVNLVEAAGSPLALGESRLKVERRGLSRQSLKIELKAAKRGADLGVFMENEVGTLVEVGALRESRPGVYQWRVRTRKGGALPFGVADVADLSGREVAIRTAGGADVAGATFPVIDAAMAEGLKRLRVRSGLSVDTSLPAVGDDQIDARIEVRQKDDGREVFKVEVDHAPAGLTLEAFLEDAGGNLVGIGTLVETVTNRGSEYEGEWKSHEGGLPLGAGNLSELSGRKVEVRDGSGELVASGFVPAGPDSRSASDDSSADDNSAPDGSADDSSGKGSSDDSAGDESETEDRSGKGKASDDAAEVESEDD